MPALSPQRCSILPRCTGHAARRPPCGHPALPAVGCRGRQPHGQCRCCRAGGDRAAGGRGTGQHWYSQPKQLPQVPLGSRSQRRCPSAREARQLRGYSAAGGVLPGETLPPPAGHRGPRLLRGVPGTFTSLRGGTVDHHRTSLGCAGVPQCPGAAALQGVWIWCKHGLQGPKAGSGLAPARTQPEDEGTGGQQHVADVPEVAVQVVEQRPAGAADQAAVQAADLRAE